MSILDDLYGSNNGPVQSNTLMANPNYSAGQQGDTVGGIGNASGMGLDINWSAPTTQTLAIGDVFSTPAGDYQAVDNGYGQIGLVPLGGAIQTGSDIQYNVAHGDHHYGINPNTGEAWYQQSQGPSASLYSTEYDVPADTSEGQAYAASQSSATTGSADTTTSNANEELTANGQCEGNDFVVTYSDGRVERVPNYGYCLNGELLDLPVDHSTSSTVNNTTTNTTTTNTDTNNNSNNAPALTAAGLASALSMLIPQPEPPPPAKTGVMGPSSGGSFSPAPIQRLSFSSPQLAPIGSSNQIDYVKQIRAGLFKDLV